MATADQISRLGRDWRNIAGDHVDVEQIGGTFYGWTSEVASLRLLRAYRDVDRADQGFSANIGRFYFRLEVEG